METIKLTLLGEPKSNNTIYRSHCKFLHPVRYLCAKGKELKEQYHWEVKSQYRGEVLIGDVKLEIKYFMKTKRKFDIDNGGKLAIDSLMDGGVIKDDSQITELHLFKNYDKENPRIELTIAVLA